MPPRAFTLIELLVVVTIIVVLLALLAPALDKAIYQAELAVCGTRLHASGAGVGAYAMDFKRWYPTRGAVGTDFTPIQLRHAAGAFDVRPLLKDHLSLKVLLDPLAGEVDLNTPVRTSQVLATYALWFGWTYLGEAEGLRKMGGRVTYQGDAFNVLVSDIDMIHIGALSRNSHPDRDGVMELIVRQDEGAGVDLGVAASGATETSSWWFRQGVWQRGIVDSNYGLTDGSVHRYHDVLWNDPDMMPIPANPRNPQVARGLHVPLNAR